MTQVELIYRPTFNIYLSDSLIIIMISDFDDGRYLNIVKTKKLSRFNNSIRKKDRLGVLDAELLTKQKTRANIINNIIFKI